MNSLPSLIRATLFALSLLFAALTAHAQIEPPLLIQCSSDYTLYTCGKPVQAFYAPSVSGTCSSNASVTCTPPDESFLDLGIHPVQCLVMDTCGNRTSCVFTVTVAMDTNPPQMICPTNRITYAYGSSAAVDYELPLVNDLETDNEFYCTPGPGSIFPIGTNVVTCVAYDPCGNSNTCQFTIEVRKAGLGLGGNAAFGGLKLDYDDGVECADNVLGPWVPAGQGGGSMNLFPTDPAKFFKVPDGIDRGVPFSRGAEIAYIETGLNSPALTPGVTLQRILGDEVTTYGENVLAAAAGGGLGRNVWSTAIQIPFTFWFYGEPFTQLCLSKHGLATFSTNVANMPAPAGPTSEPRKLPDTNLPPDTIQCFASSFQTLEPGNDVRAYLYGVAPARQVWFIWHGHPRFGHGRTTTALVLEETSNRILMVDMQAENPPLSSNDVLNSDDEFDPTAPLAIAVGPDPTATLAVGVQHDATHFSQVPASPRVLMVNELPGTSDNDFYLFKPFNVGKHKHGGSVGALSFVDAEAAGRMKSNNIPGATVAVTYKGRLIFNKGFGYANVERDIDMQPWHRAGMGSVSKIFTAVGIFKAIEMGLIGSVEDSILLPNLMGKAWFTNAFLQGIANGTHPSTGMLHLASIKLKHLLSHTSGYPGSGSSYDDLRAVAEFNNGDYATSSYTNNVQYFMANRRFVTNAPGLRETYANQAFGQLGLCIQHSSGLSYVDFMQQHVLEPIGIKRMKMRSVYLNEEDPDYDSRRYPWYGGGRPHDTNRFTRQLTAITYGFTKVPLGSQGSWTATAADMARFMCATDRLNNHADILTTNTLNVMESDPVPGLGGFAHGWIRGGNGRLSHNGATGYSSSFMMRNTNQVNVTVICNTGNVGFCQNLAATIYNTMVNTPGLLTGLPQFYDLFPSEQKVQVNP